MISVYDHGFLYGLGLFETFRTYDGTPFLLDRHLHRLREGCAQLGIPYDRTAAELSELISKLLGENRLQDAYVRLTVSAGTGELGLPSGDYTAPNEIIMVKALPPMSDELYVSGRELRKLQTSRNTPEGAIRLKSLHYMNNIVARKEMLAIGAAAGAEGLMLTREGWLAEGIVSNLFFVRQDRVICTPSIDTGILPGITRGYVLEQAELAGLQTEQGLYTWDDLLGAEEVWLTGSVQELVPVTKLTDASGASKIVGGGKSGPVHRLLLSRYREAVHQ
ncbi:aminotransferase class IV [Paenibacillus sp. GCM10023252]|uniref:aminotransferase class IV n=1 Tax=Paenibacillus sp. GCM10023252 TaxID=3252649 RepID=UPI00360D1430